MGHKGTPRNRQTIADKLQDVEQATLDLNMILVWDGHAGQEETIVTFPTTTMTDNKEEPSSSSSSSSSPNTIDHRLIRSNKRRNASIFQVVSLAEGLSTDEYIMEQLLHLKQQQGTTTTKVQVVTADRALRRKVLETKPVVRGVVNPVVFWRRYRPRLTGLKTDYSNVPKFSIIEEDGELGNEGEGLTLTNSSA